MIKVYYDPIFGCTGWKIEKPKTETRSKKKKQVFSLKKISGNTETKNELEVRRTY
jgi:hypothetical protein